MGLGDIKLRGLLLLFIGEVDSMRLPFLTPTGVWDK